nr:hypothetical protein [Tanacetum cinerariifolium]
MKHTMSTTKAESKSQMYLDELELGVTGFMIMMVYVTNVGRTVQQRPGSRILDFYLANSRGQAVRVTLWGGLGEKLIEKKNAMLGYRLYLSRNSSTLIIDDDSIPAMKQMKTDQSGVETGKETLSMDFSEAKADTLENLLMWERNRRNDVCHLFPYVHLILCYFATLLLQNYSFLRLQPLIVRSR